MDKNFIRIDDLVRQHLEGAEENERGGAWLKMRDLLDKEMPQEKKRIGIIYWRRLFGVVAAASLIGTLAVGGYEFSTAYKNLQNAEAVLPMKSAASTESGQIAVDMPVSEPENEPATSGNISVRANTHAARTTGLANATSNNTTPNNKTVNNATNNNQNSTAYNNANTTTTEAEVNSNVTKTGSVAVTGKTDNGGNGNNTDIATTTPATTSSKVVPDKPVGDDNRAKKHNNTNPAANKTTGTNNLTNKENSVATGKTVAANTTAHQNGAVAKAGTAKHSTSGTGAKDSGHTGNGVIANNASNAIAKNEEAASVPNSNNHEHQTIGALNSSAPKTAAATPTTTSAEKHDFVKGKDVASLSSVAETKTSGTKTNGGANNYSGHVKTTATRKQGTHSDNATATKDGVGNSHAANKATNKLNPSASTAAGKTNHPSSSADKAVTAAASNSLATTSATEGKTNGTSEKASSGKSTISNSHLSGNVHAKRIHKETPKPVVSTSAPAKSGTAANTSAASEEDESDVEETIVTKTTAATTNNASSKTDGTASKNTASKTTATTAQHKSNNSHEAGNAKATNNGKPATSKQTVNALALNIGGNGDNDKQDDKKTITKMVVREREVKNSDNEVMTAVDTLSMETMNRGLATEENENEEPSTVPTTPASKATATTSINEPATSENKPESGEVKAKRKRHHGNNASATLAEENGFAANEAVPAAAAAAPATEEATSSSAPAEAATKAKTKSKHSGASLMNRMSAMFNDVKNQARGARPVAGITAGVNSNFFGPSKMMGFQFGMTGSMEFSEQWSLMAELKYFHRVNNNTINDDYYTYTQMGGQYQKQLVQTSYDFAAVHNIEMPMTIRYAKGNFNFFTGPNLLYSFSINTARATLPDMNAPTMVNAMGTDNAPKYNDADFGSRFGLGYIFGFSYQVAPNTSLDLRNVQTVWDNASTAGAKSVSSMLYRTPSVQLSIMYRLGGKKNEE